MKSNKLLFLIIVAVGCLGQMASDIYTPSIPAIAAVFHAPLSLIQFSMAIYMLGYGASHLIYGPLSEGLGRQTPLFIGLLIMLVGCLLCVFAKSAHTFFGHIAGYAGALYGAMQIAGGAVIGTLVAHLPHANQVPFAWITIVCPLLAWALYHFYVKPFSQS